MADLQKPSFIQHLVDTYLIQQPSADNGEPAAGSTASLFSGDTDTSGAGLLAIVDPSANASDSGGSTDGNSFALSLFA